MPKKHLQRYLPHASEVRNHWLLSRLGEHLLQPRLWHLNRHSVSGAASIGLFVAFLPIPFQMVIAGLGAVWLRVNLPLAVGLIFITNPLTMGPAYYACYSVGTWILGSARLSKVDNFQPTMEWLFEQLALIWQPLVLGCLIIGTLAGALGYVLVQLLWRSYIVYKRGSLLRSRSKR